MTFRSALFMILTLTLAAPLGAITADPAARTVSMTAGDDMKFSVSTINAKPGEQLRIVLRVMGTMPKIAMAHNVVVLAKGTNLDAFTNASAMARSTNFIAPEFSKSVIAATGLGGAGDTVHVTFTVPKASGRYDFVCSFPGHFAGGMRGVLVVK